MPQGDPDLPLRVHAQPRLRDRRPQCVAAQPLEPRPLVLLGDCWPPVVQEWQRQLVVSNDDVRILNFAGTPEEAVAIIKEKSPQITQFSQI